MTKHVLNLFALEDLVSMRCTYRLLEVTDLPHNDQYPENLQRLVGMVAKDTREPACLYRIDDKVYVATTADVGQMKKEWRLVPYITKLILDPRDYQLDYRAITPTQSEVALNLLRYQIRTALGKNRDLWNDTPGSFYLRTPRHSNGYSKADVLEGFVFRLHYLLDGKIYLSLDPTVRYVDRMSLLDHLNAGEEFRDFKFQHFLYRNGYKWYRVQLYGLTDDSIAEQSFVHQADGKAYRVYDWIVQSCQSPHPEYVSKLDPNSPGIIYRYPNGGRDFFGAAALCFKSYRTDDQRIHQLHSESILQPSDRLHKSRELIRKYFNHVSFGPSGSFTLSDQPLGDRVKHFNVPDLLFGGGQVLHVQENSWDDGTPIQELGRKRMDLLLDPWGGVLVQDGLQKQYIFIPLSLHRSISKTFQLEFTKQMERLLSHDYTINPILFDDRAAKNLRQQVESIKHAVEDNHIDRGCALLILPERCDPDLHNFIKRELFETLQFQCVHSSSLKRYFNAESAGKYFGVRDNCVGKFISYTRNTALGMLMVNHKWPFALNSPLHYDVYIGIDVLNTMAGFTYVYNGGRNTYFRHYRSRQAERLSKKQIFSVLHRDLQRDIRRLGLQPHSIVIHRDGRSFAQEEDGFVAAVERLKNEQVLARDVQIGVVEIHKTTMGRLRLFEERNTEISNPRIGSRFVIDKHQAIVCNTGRPFRFPGTVAPLHVSIAKGDLEIEKALEDVFALSQLAWSAPDKSSRLPVTIKLGDMFLQPVASEFDEEDALYGEEELVEGPELVEAIADAS